MKQYNCPDCTMIFIESCDGCPRTKNVKSNIVGDISEGWKLPKTDSIVNFEVCKNCGNNPANGGSGICNCALPYMSSTGIR